MKMIDGYMPFREYRTYYRVVGEAGAAPPLLLLHGGPGYTARGFELLDPLAEISGRQIITYDQLGCGRSSMPEQPALWQPRTWLDELAALRRHLGLKRIHLLGHSWGGMLAIQYLCDERPEGVLSLILSSTLPSTSLWEKEGRRLAGYLPQPMQDAIRESDASGDYTGPAWAEAIQEYLRRHCYGTAPGEQPEWTDLPENFGAEAYLAAWGPCEFLATGTLKQWEYRDKLHIITCPTLVLSGLMDECTPLIAKTIHDAISGSAWELFEFSAHMTYVTEKEKYCRVLAGWLREHEAGCP